MSGHTFEIQWVRLDKWCRNACPRLKLSARPHLRTAQLNNGQHSRAGLRLGLLEFVDG